MNLKFDVKKLTEYWNIRASLPPKHGYITRLTQEQMSEKIQRHAFSLGFTWKGSDKLSIRHSHKNYVYIGNDGMCVSCIDDSVAFERNTKEEATLDFFDTKPEGDPISVESVRESWAENNGIGDFRPTCIFFDDPIANPDITLETEKDWKNRRIEAIIRFIRKRLEDKKPLPKSVVKEYNRLTEKR